MSEWVTFKHTDYRQVSLMSATGNAIVDQVWTLSISLGPCTMDKIFTFLQSQQKHREQHRPPFMSFVTFVKSLTPSQGNYCAFCNRLLHHAKQTMIQTLTISMTAISTEGQSHARICHSASNFYEIPFATKLHLISNKLEWISLSAVCMVFVRSPSNHVGFLGAPVSSQIYRLIGFYELSLVCRVD